MFRVHILIILITVGVMNTSFASSQEIPFFSAGSRIDTKAWYLSHGWANGVHQSCEWRNNAIGAQQGRLTITLSERGGKKRPFGCGEIQSKEKYGHGRYEARMRTAKGSGLNTAFFTYIGQPHQKEHDEIDFEFLGKNPTVVEVTHYRNSKKGTLKAVQLGFDSSEEFHNYAFEWDAEEIRWYVDDKLVFKTEGTVPVPIHKQKIFFSLWSGGKSMNDWLGRFKYKQPVTAEIEWVKFTPFENQVQPLQTQTP